MPRMGALFDLLWGHPSGVPWRGGLPLGDVTALPESCTPRRARYRHHCGGPLARLARFLLRRPLFNLGLLPAAAFETLAMHLAPVEGLGGLLLTLQTADQHFFMIRPPKTVLAKPHLPARTSLPIRADNLTADESGLAPQAGLGYDSLVCLSRWFFQILCHNAPLRSADQIQKFS